MRPVDIIKLDGVSDAEVVYEVVGTRPAAAHLVRLHCRGGAELGAAALSETVASPQLREYALEHARAASALTEWSGSEPAEQVGSYPIIALQKERPIR